MGQATKRDDMTQHEVDELVRLMESGEAALGMPAPFDAVELARKTKNNYRQLEYAIKRCGIEGVANVGPEELLARFAQVHHYAHWNWLLKRGFTDKKDFRAFVEREAARRGLTLGAWWNEG